VLIERLTSEEYEENDYGGLPELIESIKLQDSGPTEASRAIRKKLLVLSSLYIVSSHIVQEVWEHSSAVTRAHGISHSDLGGGSNDFLTYPT